MPGLMKEQLGDLVTAAHRKNKLVAVHENVQKDGLKAMEAGADEIAHIFDDTPISRELLTAAAANHVAVTPTLAIISAVGGHSNGMELANDTHFAPYLLKWTVDILKVKLPAMPKHHYEYVQAAVRALHEAGVTILAGTDAPNPDTTYGGSVHQELPLLTSAG